MLRLTSAVDAVLGTLLSGLVLGARFFSIADREGPHILPSGFVVGLNNDFAVG